MKRATWYIIFCFVLFGSVKRSFSQQVGVGTNSPNSSAMLDVTSINKGMLIPRMLSTQRTGIPSPANGLLVYDIDSSSLFVYQLTSWRRIKALSSINNLVSGANAGDVLVWDGSQWVITPKCSLFTYYFRDKDGDGHGDKYQPVLGCSPLPGFVADSTDCDDNNASIYGNAPDICDGIDNNCNGIIDEGPLNIVDLPDDTFTDQNGDGIDGNECAAIFVAVTGNDANPGTKLLPVATIAAGIAKASAAGKTQVYISSGTYSAKIAMVNGISLYGGYNATAGWSRSTGNTTIIQSSSLVSGRVSALEAINITSATTVDRFTIQTGNATGSGGTGNYAVYCNACTALTLKNSIIVAGNGSIGSAGSDGVVGTAGGSGINGFAGSCDANVTASGGGGGTSSCSGAGGNGGAGSYDITTGINGSNGLGAAPGIQGTGGAPGNNTAGSAGGNGTNGGNGTIGTNGAGGIAGGTIVSGVWVSSVGGPGTNGTNGSGGGGGGGGGGQGGTFVVSGTGNGGGGGGGGGCGALGATGGTGGGASFGLFLLNSTGVILTNNTITSGNGGSGGNGGNGANGGTGGTGGAGASVCIAEVGKGGNGGNGGNGAASGAGGGGTGGSSYSIGRSGTTVTTAGNTLISGIGGTGGAGGARPGGGSGGNGTNGAAGTLF